MIFKKAKPEVELNDTFASSIFTPDILVNRIHLIVGLLREKELTEDPYSTIQLNRCIELTFESLSLEEEWSNETIN